MVTLLTIIAQLRKPTKIVMLIHVRKPQSAFGGRVSNMALSSGAISHLKDSRASIAYNISPAEEQ